MRFFLFITTLLYGVSAWTWTTKSVDIMRKKVPVVFAGECDRLRKSLTLSSIGSEFLFMFDHDVESFECTPDNIRDDLKLLLQTSLVLMYHTGIPVVQIDTNRLNTSSHDLINSHNEMVQSLNLIRGFLQGGYSDVYNMERWNVSQSSIYDEVVSQMKKCFKLVKPERIDKYFIGHECVFLPYEESLCRMDSISGKYYATSSHILWTRNNTLPFLQTIENPIGLEINDNTNIKQVLRNIKKINPNGEMGKVLLITRMSNTNLSHLLRLLKDKKIPVCLCADIRKIKDTNFIRKLFQTHKKAGTFSGVRMNPDIENAFLLGSILSSI